MAEQDSLRNRFRARMGVAQQRAQQGFDSARNRVNAAVGPARSRLGAAAGAARESWRDSGTPQRPTLYVDGAGRASAVPPGERGRYTTEGSTGRNNPNYQGARADPTPPPAEAPQARRPGRFARYGGGALAAVGEVPQLAAAAEQGSDELAAEIPRSAGRMAGATYGMRIGHRAGGGRGRGGLVGGLVGGGVGYVGGERAVDAVMNATTPSDRGLLGDMRARRGAADSGGPDDTTGVRAWNNAPGAWASSDPQARREAVDASGYSFDPSAPENQLAPSRTAPTRAAVAAARANEPGAADILNPDGTVRQSRTISAEDRAASRGEAEAQAARATASPNVAGEIQGITRRATNAIDTRASNARSGFEQALLNPMGSQAELVRRLQNTQTSARNRGSPQARRLMAQPYLEALGMAGEARMEGLSSGNDAVVRGAADEGAAHEGFARRADAAQQANQTADVGREEIAGRSYRETLKVLADQNASEEDRQAALNQRYDDYRTEWLENNPDDYDGATQHAARMARQEGLVDERGVPVGRAAAMQQSAEIERRFDEQSGPGFMGLRSLGRLASGLDAGDPQARGSRVFDQDEFDETGPRGGRQWLATRRGDSVWRNRVTGQEILAPATGGRHERAAAERDPEGYRRRLGRE